MKGRMTAVTKLSYYLTLLLVHATLAHDGACPHEMKY